MRAWCISDGNLWLMQGDGPARQVESAFANEAVARAERERRNDAWKHAPREDYQGVIPQNMLWGGTKSAEGAAPPRFRHAVRGADADSLYYMLEMSASSGLFHYRLSDGRETRIFHTAKFRCLGLAYDPDRDALVIATGNNDGTAHLAVYDKDGNSKGNITGGDTVDSTPSISARDKAVVFYQSAGVARDPQKGYVVAVGPSAVNRLDYASGKLETVLEDRNYDFLCPREDRDGNLYYIRRPFERSATEHAHSFLVDALMFPWRMVKAIFGYLNFFSAMYGREPLRSSGGPNALRLEQDVARLWLHGRMIDLTRVQQDRERETGGLVPASWQLRRRAANEEDTMVAEHVVGTAP
jgi:hypothetical protein